MATKKKQTARGKKPAARRAKPAEQATPPGASPVSGTPPPAEHQWKPGQSGNPAGRPPAAGASVREWLNTMQGWTRLALAEVLKGKEAPVNKVAAARWWLHACSLEKSKGGLPIATGEVAGICEQTAGKPRQAVALTAGDGGPLKVVVEYLDPPPADPCPTSD